MKTNVTSFGQFAALTGDDVRVTLNKWPGKRQNGDFTEMLGLDDLKYACHNTESKTSFRNGFLNLVFVRVDANRYLFVAALRITANSGPDGFCRYEDETAKAGLLPFSHRLVVSDASPNKTKMGAWVFRASRLADLMIESYDSAPWSKLKWKGYDAVNLTFRQLYDIIESGRYAEYRAHLQSASCVYALKDTNTGKLYVGSAYGENGIAQRWKHYLESGHGGNKRLKELFDAEGIGYFMRYFTFSVIRDFPLGADPKRVIAFESRMKDLLDSRSSGYNAN